MDDVATAVRLQQEALLRELATGAGVTALGASAGWLAGRWLTPEARRRDVAAFARQSLAWAAVDAAIVAWGRRGLLPAATQTGPAATTGPATTTDPTAAALATGRRLRRLTLVNAVLDVGYVAGGAALARRTGRRGDGLAIVVQGLFLLWLDVRHTRRFHRVIS